MKKHPKFKIVNTATLLMSALLSPTVFATHSYILDGYTPDVRDTADKEMFRNTVIDTTDPNEMGHTVIGQGNFVSTDVGATVTVGNQNNIQPNSVNTNVFGYQNGVLGANTQAFGSLNFITGDNSTVSGIKNTVSAVNTHLVGKENEIYGQNHFIGGYKNTTYGESNTLVGNENRIHRIVNGDPEEASNSVAIGTKNNVGGNHTVVIGSNSNVDSNYSVGIGSNTTITNSANSFAIGDANTIKNSEMSLTVGTNQLDNAAYSTAMGYHNIVKSAFSTVIGSNINVGENRKYSVVVGYDSTIEEKVATEKYTINGTEHTFAGKDPIAAMSIGAEGTERTLTHLAAGRISSDSTDAINGSQLYAVTSELDKSTQSISDIKTKVDKNTKDIADNKKAVSDNTKEITKVKDRVTKLEDTVPEVTGGENIKVEKSTGSKGQSVYKVSTNGLASKADLDLIKAETINKADEAKQIAQKAHQVSIENRQLIESNTKEISRLNTKVHRIDKKTRAGIASVAAIAGAPQVFTPGKSMVSVGVSNYRGESGLSAVYSRANDSGHAILKAGLSINTQHDVIATGGVGYQW